MKKTTERTQQAGRLRVDRPRAVQAQQVKPGQMLALGDRTLLVRSVHPGEEWTALQLILLVSSQGIVELKCDPFAGSAD